MFKGEPRQVQGRAASVMAVCLFFLCLQVVGGVTTSVADSCLNEELRIQQGTNGLPLCRAYEMVTPLAKGSGEPEIGPFHSALPSPNALSAVNGARTNLDGGRLAWVSEPMPGAVAPGVSRLATRGNEGWTSKDLVPSMSPLNDIACPVTMGVSGWSSDLTRSVLDLPAGAPITNEIAPLGFDEGWECGHDQPRLVAGEPEHFRNLFVRDNLADSYQLVNVTPEGILWPEPEEPNQRYWPASFIAGSDDLGHVVFEEELALTPDAPIGYRGGNELYEWANGQVRLVTILPDGTPVHGSLASATRNYAGEFDISGEQASNVAQFRHAVSAGGSRIFFEAGGSLYLRENGATTVQVDASQGPDPSGGGKFMVASSDGSRIFFTSDKRLTTDSTASSGEPDLYEYRITPGGGGMLRDLTINPGEPANVLGVSGASEDGEYVYLVARGGLSTEQNSEGELPVPGEPNLYLIHQGAPTFVATLDSSADDCDWTAAAHCGGAAEAGPSLTARTSRSGHFLAFNSVRSLTGYDNTSLESGKALIEIFLFDATANQLSCVSCLPNGVPPVAGAAIRWPANPGINNSWSNAYPQRNLSDGGQVFFETADPLLPQDGNGVRDVYEYLHGSLHLLSTGSGESGFRFLDASPDGSDVFIGTAQALLPRDTDLITDYYDVRVGGGFSEPPSPPAGCDDASCRNPGAAADGTQAGTHSFEGPGNTKPHKHCRRHHPGRHRGKRGKGAGGTKAKGSIVRKCKRSKSRRGAVK
jgi:hypothetical protein